MTKGLRGAGVAAIVALSVAFGSTATSAVGAPKAAAKLPAGFTDTLVATLGRPTALAPTPDGRVLAVDQDGIVRVIEDGAMLPTPALDISAKVCATNSERGMLGIAVNPNFATNGFVYIYYTFMKFPGCRRDRDTVPVNRVSRFTMTGDTIDPGTEKVLVDNMESYNGNHNAGDLGFGGDGMLYASVGDGGCDYRIGTSACDPLNAIAQSLNTLQGKVLRITPSGAIPKDNPFTGPGTARCNHGPVASDLKCREIYLYGFRNPFRFAFDPNSGGTRMFVDDTGQATWEEVNEASPGANYGWNVREGPCARGSTTDCGPPPPGLTNPVFAYSHGATHCGAITGGAFVPDGLWDSTYDGSYLLADYVCDRIYRIVPTTGGKWKSNVFARGLAIGGPIEMKFMPYAGTTALWYTTMTTDPSQGQIRVITQS